MANLIVPIQSYTVNQATQIQLSLQYIFDAVDCTIIVNYLDSNGNQLGTNSVYIPEAVYSTWSADQPIIEYVLAQLGLTAA